MKHKMYVTYAKNGFVMIRIRKVNLNFIIKSENDHYIGKFRGAAHNICKLSYKVTKKIPVVFHNGSTYDCHFTTKQLAEKFKGQFECLRENTEKYITFSILIKNKLLMLEKKKIIVKRKIMLMMKKMIVKKKKKKMIVRKKKLQMVKKMIAKKKMIIVRKRKQSHTN